jgi:hypothetical protein
LGQAKSAALRAFAHPNRARPFQQSSVFLENLFCLAMNLGAASMVSWWPDFERPITP